MLGSFGLFGFIFFMASADPNGLYVSPSGNDATGDGSLSKPWKTISMARDAVRDKIANGLASDVTIYLGAGVYELDETLELDVRDSAPAGRTITYASKDGAGAAILKSSSLITNNAGWIYFTNGIWRIQVGSGHDIDTLYEGDLRGIEARYPNRGVNRLYPQARAPYLVSKSGGVVDSDRSWIECAGKDFPAVSAAAAKHIVIFPWGDANWHLWTCDISSVETNANRIYFNNLGNTTEIGELARYFVSGALGFLDSKGEFFYDSISGDLYYKPRTPGNPAYKNISVPVLKTLVNIAGSNNTDSVVQGLEFQGLVFSDTAAVVPALQWWDFDWGKDDFAIIKMRNTSNIRVEKCHIKNAGRHGILAVGHNEGLWVESSLVENTGVNGMVLCNRFSGGTSDRIKNCVITNCVVQNVGNLSLYASCIGLMATESCVVDQCELYDSARYAVTLRGNATVGGGFSSFPRSTDNLVRNCWVERCMQDGGDGGAIHQAGINDGTRPYTNYFENIYIYNTASVLGQNDHGQLSGLFMDWPTATEDQSFKNIWVYLGEGSGFRDNENTNQVFDNVSWVSGFDPSLVETNKIGLSESLPSAFGFSRPAYGLFRDIVLDNNDPGFSEYGDDWWDSSLGRGKTFWKWRNAPNSRGLNNSFGANAAVWRPDIVYAGYYDVYVWKFQSAAASTIGVDYSVVSGGITNRHAVNQQEPSNVWELLGTYYFEQGTNGYVLLDADSAASGEQVRADAIRLVAIAPKEESLWEEGFEGGYIAGADLVGQNGWVAWYGASPVVRGNSGTGVFVEGVSGDDARSRIGIDPPVGSNSFVAIQFSASIPDTTSITASQNHVGLGSESANAVEVNAGINATGIFFSPDGIAQSSFVYGYSEGIRFVPDPAETYTIKAELNILAGTARLYVATDGLDFKQLSFNAAGTLLDTPFDTASVSNWNAVYVRMGTHVGNKIHNLSVTN